MQRVRKLVVAFVLLAFIGTLLVNFIHTPHDHEHNSSCSIYVLEQLFVSDTPPLPIDILLTLAVFAYVARIIKMRRSFRFSVINARAPPLLNC
jgi:hypothetical protein